MNMVPRKWPHQWLKAGACAAALVMAAHAGAAETVKIGFIDPVSYTHLTLPTNREV